MVRIISFCSLVTIRLRMTLVCWGDEGAGGSVTIRACLVFTACLPYILSRLWLPR